MRSRELTNEFCRTKTYDISGMQMGLRLQCRKVLTALRCTWCDAQSCWRLTVSHCICASQLLRQGTALMTCNGQLIRLLLRHSGIDDDEEFGVTPSYEIVKGSHLSKPDFAANVATVEVVDRLLTVASCSENFQSFIELWY